MIKQNLNDRPEIICDDRLNSDTLYEALLLLVFRCFEGCICGTSPDADQKVPDMANGQLGWHSALRMCCSANSSSNSDV